MKLEELIPREKDLLDFSAEDLADRIIICLVKSGNSSPISRRGLAARLLRGYPNEYGKDGLFAIEEAIMFLEHEMLIGIDPEEREFVFITRKGKEKAELASKNLLSAV